MRAQQVVLPMVWATAPVAAAARAVAERKGPQSLRLVQAQEEVAVVVAAPVRRGFPVFSRVPEPEPEPETPSPVPELAFYRKYTEAMLSRYLKLSMEAGRVPSLLGREMFRGNVTSCRVRSFEDVVIFVHDVERCLATLGKGQQALIARIGLQGHTQEEVARMQGTSLRSVIRRYGDALDDLTRVLMERGLLEPVLEGGGGQA